MAYSFLPYLGDKESMYSGIGSPCTSVTGSYSSGDEVGWSNGAFSRGDSEIIPPQGMGNNPQMVVQPAESSFDTFPVLDMKAPPQNLNSQPHFEGLQSPTEGQGFYFPPNRASPNRVSEGVRMLPEYKNQNPTAVPTFKHVNNPAQQLGRASPTCHSPRPVNPYATNGYSPKVLQTTEYTPPHVSGPGFNFQRGNSSKFQQHIASSLNNNQPKIDARSMAGFPRNNFNHRFHHGSQNQIPTWLKHNPPPNLRFQQNAAFARNYNSFPGSPTNPAPMPVGEFATAIEDCQIQLQNLEKERRKVKQYID